MHPAHHHPQRCLCLRVSLPRGKYCQAQSPLGYPKINVIPKVATGQLPYAHRSNDHSVTVDIMRGIKPNKGVSLAIHGMELKCVKSFWAMLDRCWDDQGPLRPSMREMLNFLENMVVS